MKKKRMGKVWLVGAGPGDPGLLTLRAKECLERAQAVVFDTLISPALFRWIPQEALLFHRGRRGKEKTLHQEDIHRLLVRLAKKGLCVVRLKGGDPFLFGRGGEEAEYLKQKKIPYEVVSGVSAALAVPAYAGIPVTHRDQNASLTIVTGHEAKQRESRLDWKHLAQENGTLLFLMALRTLPQICKRLLAFGKSPGTPAAVIQCGTTRGQKIVIGRLRNLPSKIEKTKLHPPALLVVGPVVSFAKKLQWVKRERPLLGRRILITAESAWTEFLDLENQGAELVPCFLLRYAATGERLPSVKLFDGVVFTSPRGVAFWWKKISKYPQLWQNKKFFAVGSKTGGVLKELGFSRVHTAAEHHQEGLYQKVKKVMKPGQRVLLVQGRDAEAFLEKELRRTGIILQKWCAYRSEVNFRAKEILRYVFEVFGGVDLTVLGSPLGARLYYRWLEHFRIPAESTPVAVLGVKTQKEARRLGGHVVFCPDKPLWRNIAEAVSRYCFC